MIRVEKFYQKVNTSKVKNPHCGKTEHFSYILWLGPGPSREGRESCGVCTGRNTHTHTHAHTKMGRMPPWSYSTWHRGRIAPLSEEQVRIVRCFYQVFICNATYKCLLWSLLKLSGTGKAFCVSTGRRKSKVKPAHCPLSSLPYTSLPCPSTLCPLNPKSVLKPYQRAWVGPKVKKGLGWSCR